MWRLCARLDNDEEVTGGREEAEGDFVSFGGSNAAEFSGAELRHSIQNWPTQLILRLHRETSMIRLWSYLVTLITGKLPSKC